MEKQNFYESILSRVANKLAQYQTYDPVPPTDSSIETRKKEGLPSGSGFGAGLTRDTGFWYDQQMQVDKRRIAKYKDYDLMDTEDPELASALDIYADNATKGESETDVVINIISKDQSVITALNEVIKDLKLNTELWSITRELVKNGDCFEEVVAYDDGELHRLKHLDENKMVVIQDEWGRLDSEYPYQQKGDTNQTVAKFEDWQIIHFKLKKDRKSTYGVDGSVLAPIRKLYKQLAMLEDSLVLARLTRAIQRYAYLIDTEGIESGDDTLEYLDKVMERMKKRRTIKPDGSMDLDYNPMSMEEDIFISTKSDSKANVKVLQGATNLGQLADVEYFRNKKFAGVKVPKAYLSHEKDVRARAMITEQDVQFARTVRRVQLAVIAGLKKLFNQALSLRDIDPNRVEYEIQLPLLSTIDELRMWQVKQLKANVCRLLHKELNISIHWILRNLLDYDEDEVQEIIKYMEDENSLDNKVIDQAIKKQDAFGGTDDGGRNKENPKGGKVPTKKDNQEPKKDRKDKDAPEERITQDQIQILRDELNEQLEDFKDIIEWERECNQVK